MTMNQKLEAHRRIENNNRQHEVEWREGQRRSGIFTEFLRRFAQSLYPVYHIRNYRFIYTCNTKTR